MMAYGAFAALSAGLSLFCTYLMRSFARSVSIVDVPDDRKVHERAIPRFGGTAVYLSFALAMALAFDAHRFLDWGFPFSVAEYAKLMIGGTAILLLGIWDDIRGASASTKLAVEIAVAGLMFVLGYRIEAISNPFGGTIALGFLSVPVTILWIIGIMNALNLIDGVDGLAAGVTLISAASSFAISALLGNMEVAVAYAILFGATLGFLRYNFNPATIFLGDSGSLFLGFLLAVLSIKGAQKGPTSVAITVPILILGLPILDTAVAFVRRTLGARGGEKSESPSPLSRLRLAMAPDRKHIHHRLLGFGFSHRQVALLLYAVSALLSAVAMLSLFANRRGVAGLLIFTAVFAVAAVMHLGWFAFRKSTFALPGRRPSRALVLAEGDAGDAAAAAVADLRYALVRAEPSAESVERLAGGQFDVVVVHRDAASFSPDLFARARESFRFAVPILLTEERAADPESAAREAARLGAYDRVERSAGIDRWHEVLGRAFEKSVLLARLRFVYGVAWICVIFMPILIALTFCACRDGLFVGLAR